MPGKLSFLRWLKYKYLLFIRIKDHPRSIATGAALGVSFDVLPTFGLGIIFAYFLAVLLRVNRLAAVIAAVVFKLAIPFFIYINVQTGQIFIEEKYPVALEMVSSHWFKVNWSQLGASFLLGSVINSLLIFVVTYFIIYHFTNWKRARSANNK